MSVIPKLVDDVVKDVTDEQLIAVGKAALLWHAENGDPEHDIRCEAFGAPTDSRNGRPMAPCICGLEPLLEALSAVWDGG